MARPNGSRKVRGWIITPKIAELAKVSLSGDLTKDDEGKLLAARKKFKESKREEQSTKQDIPVMAPLKGSQKQIPIAESIRQERISSMNKVISEMKDFVKKRRELGDTDEEIATSMIKRTFEGGKVSVGKGAYITDTFNLRSALSFGRIKLPDKVTSPDSVVRLTDIIANKMLPRVNSAGWWIDNNSGNSSALAGFASKGKIRLTETAK